MNKRKKDVKANPERNQKLRERRFESSIGEEIDPVDDGHTIADMSDVPHGMLSGGRNLVERRRGTEKRELQGQERPSRPWEDAPLSRRERWMYMLGAMKATLLIGLAYLIGFGILIGVMMFLW